MLEGVYTPSVLEMPQDPQEDLENADVRTTLLGPLPLRPGPRQAVENGRMEGYMEVTV